MPGIVSALPSVRDVSMAHCLDKVSVRRYRVRRVLKTRCLSVHGDGGRALLHHGVNVLPTSFDVRVGNKVRTGRNAVMVAARRPYMTGLGSGALRTAHGHARKQARVRLGTRKMPPTFVALRILPGLTTSPVSVRLPFPTGNYLTLSMGKHPLSGGVALRSLLNSETFLFSEGNRPAECALRLRLHSIDKLRT